MFRCARLTFLCAICAVVPGIAQSQPSDIKDVLETRDPVEIPGGVLGPGTYVLKLAGEPAEANVARALSRIDVFDRNGVKLIAKLYTVPDYLPPNPKATFTFYESEPGRAKALDTWFPTGLDHGMQFVYPDEQAARIAKSAKQGVFSIPADVMRPEPDGKSTPGPVANVEAAGQRLLQELPHSASLFPLAIWVGFVAVAAAFLFRRYRRDTDAELNSRLISRNAALTRELAAVRYRSANLKLRNPRR